ncbi:MopE-related protein [Desulfuromonas sp.]|uniref:MopE-related protein n=1 Tax=Desulfuromonas sp. TaxID=892 RepID=UPI0025B8C852|nr:MopE-related protein [Desulfuromonas sp.]
MKKVFVFLSIICLVFAFTSTSAFAGKPVDNDGDGYKSNVDCNDNDPAINPGAAEICTDGIDNNCDGFTDGADPTCGGGPVDADGDGYDDTVDCDDSDPAVNPGATEICNGIDDNCDSVVDEGCGGGGTHDGITGTFDTPAQVTAKCLECHSLEGSHIANALHGLKPIATPDVVNNLDDSNKYREINTFCSYPGPEQAGAACMGCHPTLGKYENLGAADIDCLRCHNDQYKRKFTAEDDPANFYNVVDWQGTPKTYIPSKKDAQGNFMVEFNWGAMPGLTATDLIAGVHRPTTSTCLSCHAKAGGGDWTKRGDIGLNTATATAAEDVHLASAASGGAGLSCSDCHVSSNHKIPGRGIDLRPTEQGVAVKACVECHTGFETGNGHAAAGANRSEGDRHVYRVACQSCHIAEFAKGGATEMHRDWTSPHWNQALCNGQGAWAGHEVKEANVAPDHVFFNGTSYIANLGETVDQVDPASGYLTVADANGDLNDGMLVPIKRHQSNMAVMDNTGELVPYDIVWQFMTGKNDEAAERGKANAGLNGTHSWQWVEAEMAINHGVAPATDVADCSACHGSGSIDLGSTSKLDAMGYALKDTKALICSQCHAEKKLPRTWDRMHNHINKTAGGSAGIDCLFCHDFTRPERGLTTPCDPEASNYVDTNPYPHQCN